MSMGARRTDHRLLTLRKVPLAAPFHPALKLAAGRAADVEFVAAWLRGDACSVSGTGLQRVRTRSCHGKEPCRVLWGGSRRRHYHWQARCWLVLSSKSTMVCVNFDPFPLTSLFCLSSGADPQTGCGVVGGGAGTDAGAAVRDICVSAKEQAAAFDSMPSPRAHFTHTGSATVPC